MSTFPQPLARLGRVLARRATTTVHPTRTLATRRLRAGLGLLGSAGALLVGSVATADSPDRMDLDRPPAVGTEAEADGAAFGALLADWFERFDERIRTVSAATDRAASRALEGGLGALAAGHDRRLSDHARAVLADAPDAAQRHYSLAAVGAGPARAVRDDAKPPSRTSAFPAAPAPR